jgi:hypothetical protein
VPGSVRCARLRQELDGKLHHIGVNQIRIDRRKVRAHIVPGLHGEIDQSVQHDLEVGPIVVLREAPSNALGGKPVPLVAIDLFVIEAGSGDNRGQRSTDRYL